MKKEEILKQNKKDIVGEAERNGIGKANWIALICAGVVAIALMIIEGVLGHTTAIFAIAAVCYTWASVFYFCQFFVAKRPWPVLFGAVFHGAAAIAMIVLYSLFCAKVI